MICLGRFKEVFTTADPLMVERDSLVAAKLHLLKRCTAGQGQKILELAHTPQPAGKRMSRHSQTPARQHPERFRHKQQCICVNAHTTQPNPAVPVVWCFLASSLSWGWRSDQSELWNPCWGFDCLFWKLLIIVQDLDEEGTFGHILSTSKLGTRKDKQKLHFYISGENLNVYPGKSQGVCGQYVISRAQISEGPPTVIKELATIKVDCGVASRWLHKVQKVALEHTTKTTANGQLVWEEITLHKSRWQ